MSLVKETAGEADGLPRCAAMSVLGRNGSKRRKSRAPRRPPAAEARQHDIVQDIVPETAVTVAAAPARDQVPVDVPLLAAVIDQIWQANPLQKLLPVDWGAITQALSTLRARSMADPLHATKVAVKLNMRLWQEAVETWIGTASRWWGLATPTEDKLQGTVPDRRFEAPEWEQHPFFRVLKQSYLAIATQLREEADREVPDPTERHRLMF
jgi:polyhydroxyalkanoate synthase subunit PhaC